jgi:thiol:disulfide interchange protein DsbC
MMVGGSSAGFGADTLSPDHSVVRSVIEKRYPNVKVVDVKPTPIPGLLELFLGDSIAYVDASGDHLLVGTLVRTRDHRDLSAESLSARNAIDFETLPFQHAIVTVKGDGKRRLAVFSDPDCPYCEQLEKELEPITNVTIYTFLYPLTDLHPDAANKARAIWCSPNRPEAWRSWMIQRTPPVAATGCDKTPTDELLALGKKLKVTGTPTIYLGNGQRIDGSLVTGDLESRLIASTTKEATTP